MGDGLGHLGRRAIAEAIGTFFLVLIGTGSIIMDDVSGGGVGLLGVALSFAFVILAMIYAVGHLSGAHINPAVTIGFWSIGRFPSRDAAVYVLAQCAGAVLASIVLGALLDPPVFGQTVPTVGTGAAFGVEWLLSFALMFVVVAVATDDRVATGFAGLAVGLVVGFDILVGGFLTGGSMNPARSLGPAVASGEWTAHWIYWLAPIAGMVAAAWTYEALRPASAPRLVSRRDALGVGGPIDAEPPR
jgi:MIP family channel proteins